MRLPFRSSSRVFSRRDFMRAGTAATVAAAIPLTAARGMRWPCVTPDIRAATEAHRHLVEPEIMNALVLRAIDAARSAGARYADARVTRIVSQGISGMGFSDDEYLTIGIRVLVDGAWGFAASPYWILDEAEILAKEAVRQARANAAAFPQEVDLGTYPIATGSWTTPIRIDPFQIPIEEKFDWLQSLRNLTPRNTLYRDRESGASPSWSCRREERTVATSEGALFSQTLYSTEGEYKLVLSAFNPETRNPEAQATVFARGLDEASQGWERLIDADVPNQIPRLLDEAEALLYLPHKPVDVGRYEMVVTADVMTSLIASTFADATQLDRALGYEANAGGTSYLGPDPLAQLGTTVGTSLLTVHGDRSLPGGLATVKWDDEGVEPETFPIVSKGVLTDYQTTREQASWLAPWYAKQQRPVRSHGCAVAPSARDFPLQQTPNLLMQPGATNVSFDDMVRNTKKGIAFMEGGAGTDFQSRTGAGSGMLREIKDGKLGEVLDGAQIMFDSTQLWKTLLEIGGAEGASAVRLWAHKGQPSQVSKFTVSAVPGRFKDMTVVDGRRKA